LMHDSIENIKDAEFKVFSQWGDDGIINYLVDIVDIKNKVFIEFGVEDYKESNTRFLLMNKNWSGLVMDGSKQYIKQIKKDPIYWKYDLIAKQAFITTENINALLEDEELTGTVGLLSIDIDGNDYWVWNAIEVVEPEIVVIEYNSVFGIERAITVPYRADFVRSEAHFSNLYAGASLLALYELAETKGYCFLGCNSAGNNAYFVKKGKKEKLNELLPSEGYVESKFREARNKDGTLNFARGNDRLEIIKGMEVYNTRKGEIEKI